MVFQKGKSGNPEKQFQKGVSGNPRGCPKGYKTFQRALQEAVTEEIKYRDIRNVEKKMQVVDALATVLVAKALYKHDLRAIEIIYNNINLSPETSLQLLATQEQEADINPLELTDDQVLAIAAAYEKAIDVTPAHPNYRGGGKKGAPDKASKGKGELLGV